MHSPLPPSHRPTPPQPAPQRAREPALFPRARALLLALGLLAPLAAAAQGVGTVDKLVGQAEYRSPGGASQPLREGQSVQVGASIVTQAHSEVHLDMADGGVLAVRPLTHFTVQQYNADKGPSARMELSLLQGALRSITGWIGKFNAPGYRIATPTATVGIRGTDHEVTVLLAPDGDDGAGTYDSVLEGATVLRSHAGEELGLQAGEDGFVDAAQPAPRRLGQRPGFFLRRQLRLEERLEERRAIVLQRLVDALQQHPEKARDLRERLQKLSPAQREALKRHLRRQQPARTRGD
ncbi:MAG: FecR family protein [Rhodoferax sp.]